MPELTPDGVPACSRSTRIPSRPASCPPWCSRPAALAVGADAVLSQVNSYIEERPAEVARVLREWADERNRESV